MLIGIQTSGRTTVVPSNPSSPTPTTLKRWPLISTSFPTMALSRLNRLVQKECVSTTIGAAPGFSLSRGEKSRPAAARVPSVLK
jgi:hypothetical protein